MQKKPSVEYPWLKYLSWFSLNGVGLANVQKIRESGLENAHTIKVDTLLSEALRKLWLDRKEWHSILCTLSRIKSKMSLG